MPPTTTQKLAVALAVLATALSLTAVVLVFVRRGEIATTPLFGGLFMLFMSVSGLLRLRQRS